MFSHFSLHAPALGLAFLLAAGCAGEKAVVGVDPGGMLDVFGPSPRFSFSAPGGDWIVDGPDAPRHFTVVEKDRVPTLRVTAGRTDFLAARRIDARLLATPYLSWAWNVDPQGTGLHPVRLIVGFQGGKSKTGAWSVSPFARPPTPLPPHDRALAIAWGDSALNRGTLVAPADGRSWPSYTVRGGRENNGSWWLETVDLAQLYARAWPADDPANARVTFIGIASNGVERPVAAHVSGIRLSR